MVIASVVAFFVVMFLLATITVAIAWMAFVKKTAEESEVERGESAEGAGDAGPHTEAAAAVTAWDENSPLFRSERLSTLSFWNNVLARFDFINILRSRIAEAELILGEGEVHANSSDEV